MNKIVITALMAFMPAICYSVDIKGVISDINGHILEYSSVRLTSVTDSVLAKSTVSDQRGEYSIGDIKPGKYLVTALCLGFERADTCVELSGYDNVIDFRLIPAQNMLSEVVVNADRFVRGKNGITVLPSDDQVKHSSSGYELIRNLMIPGVSVNLRTNSVSALGGAVTLFIDGLPADERELRQLRPSDIKSVQYMDAPTGKYAGNNVVINLVMHKRNRGGYVAVDATQRIGYNNGDYNVASKLYRDNTQYTLFAGTDYQSINGFRSEQHEQIYFPDQIIDRTYITDDSRLSKNSQYAQFRVRNKNDKRTLRATLNFVRQHTPHDSENRKLSYHGLSDSPTDIVSSKLARSRNFKYSIGLSGSFSLPRNQFMDVSASASLSRNNHVYDYLETENEILTSTGEDFYNMHADITYGMNFSHGNHLVFKASEFYNVSSANYFGNNRSWQHLWSSETLVFSEYMHPLWGKATIRVAPGMSAQFYRVHGLDLIKYFGPRVQLVFTYQPRQRQY
ncbi:MAG: carboxypeptidase-like regulatory domain-containing protein, partial [Muribaculaceae bacterium]|nr:carboxypeptidase-like regulatory domain-containing protein [Muribaculaceae bacterium]